MFTYTTGVMGQFLGQLCSQAALIGKFPSQTWEKTLYPKSSSLICESIGSKVGLVRRS